MLEEKRGKFIVLDGIDGSGKSSQILNILNFILNKDKHNHIIVTREPYKKREIREILRQDNDAYSQAEKLADLYVNDRKEHVKEIILPALEKGIFIISDRYKFATIAYQSAQGLDINKLIEMHIDMPVPDATIIVDVPIEVAEKRMAKDSRQEHKFEADKEFQNKVRENFLKMPELLKDEKIFIVDGTKSIEEVGEEIIAILDKIV